MAETFIPRKTFRAQVNGADNTYLKGKKYTCHDGKPYDDLRKKLAGWKRAKKVDAFPAAPSTGPMIRAKVGE